MNRSGTTGDRNPLEANADLERFKKDLIAMQVRARENEHPPKHALRQLGEDELGPIPTSQKMRKDVALLFMKMWQEIDKDHKARKTGAKDSIGVASGYRSAERDEKAWHNAFPKYYHHTLNDRQATGNEFSKKALLIIYHYMNGKKAPPGFSGHTHGIAADLTTTEKGKTWTVNSDYNHQMGWQKTWLYGWLLANAWKHNFYQLKTETWHWEYHKGTPPKQCWDGHIKHRPVEK